MKSIIFIFSLIFISFIGFAQNDTLFDLGEINIKQTYEPILISTNKVPLKPTVPNFVKDKPDAQQYSFADIVAKVNYQAEDIRPVKILPKENDKQAFFYTKAGFGTQLTPLLQIGITNPNQEKYRASLNTDFIYSKNNNPKYQSYYDLNIQGKGEYFLKEKVSIGGNIGVGIDNYHFYGFPDSLDYSKDSLKNLYKRFGAAIQLKNIDTANFNYYTTIGFNNTSNKLNQKETNIDVKLGGSYFFKQHYGFGVDFLANNINFKTDTSNTNRFSIGVVPAAKIKFKFWDLSAGANIMITNKKFYVYPHIQSALKVYKDYLTIYNEWNSVLKINGLNSTSRINPFINDDLYKNSIRETRTFAGVKVGVKGFSADVRFSQLVDHWQQQFVGFENADNIYQYQMNYIKSVKSWNPHFALGYDYKNTFGVTTSFDYYIYSNNDTTTSYLPNLDLNASFYYNWKDKLFVNLGMQYLGKMNGVEATTTPNLYNINKIDGVIDLNISASYFINKHIGFFIDLNNFGFQKYQRFYQYPTYGFQAIGGVKISY
ncbi:MAG: hypothetical protein H6553_09405 [Chitinophagales bacterium]|nr:hypothetical protein [Chitinophagales bacterium]